MGCAHAPPRAAPPPPLRLRVFVAHPLGDVTALGEVPTAPPPALAPGDRWFVEPVAERLDPATVRALVLRLVRDRVPGLSLRGRTGVDASLLQARAPA
mgnify:CR=1 FL=1